MKRVTAIVLLLSALVGLSASLMWTEDLAIRQGVNIEWFRTAIDTNDGCAIYVWSDTKFGERDLYAQKVDAQGNMVWGQPLIIDQKPDRQEDPVITKTSDGNFIIAWIEFYYDQDGDVLAQKISHDGQLLWPVGGKPVCTLVGGQISLNIEPDAEGGAYIVWEDSRNPSKDIYGQRIDTNGNPVWAINGIPIASGEANISQNTMWADGQGGMIIGYHSTYSEEQDLYVKRFLPNGTMAWAQALPLAVLPLAQSKIRTAPLGNGEFVFTWQDERSGIPDIYAQKVNLDGQMLWPNPYIVHSDPDSKQQNPRIVATSDNAVIIFWEDNRLDIQNHDLFAQKINAAGTKLWATGGIPIAVAEFKQSQPRMASDGNGGCYVVWDDDRNGNTPLTDIYAQHLSSTGEALWGANGMVVCNAPNEQSGSIVKVSGNNIFINWMDMRNGSVGIYYQVYNTAGVAQLQENGVEVFWGLSGDAVMNEVIFLPLQDKSVVVWTDTRHANMGYQIYFQIINPDGTFEFEEDGRSVTLHSGDYQSKPQAVVTDQNQIVIVWEDHRYANSKIFAQLISPAGERLWGDYGMELTQSTPQAQESPKISFFEGSIYIGWSDAYSIGINSWFHTYGQKITNGVKQWGPDGILISQLPATEMNTECYFQGIAGRYFTWAKTDRFDPSLFQVFVKLVDTNGNTAPGWPDYGQVVSTYSNWDIVQVAPKLSLTPQGVFVVWGDLRMGFVKTQYGQHISATGTVLWDPLGVPLVVHDMEQDNPSVVVSHHGITYVWNQSVLPEHIDLGVQRYSFDGQPLFGETGQFMVQKPEDQIHAVLQRFAHGGFVTVWADYAGFEPDIYYRYMNDNGELLGSPEGYVLCDAAKSQYRPLTAATGNSAYVIWPDGRSSGKTEILGLFAQRITNESSTIEDMTNSPAISMQLRQNYPNPFNPETTISLDIKESGSPVELSIYNAKGQRVKTLYKGVMSKGLYNFVWNGTDDTNQRVASGIYMYKATDGKQSQTRKMVLMK